MSSRALNHLVLGRLGEGQVLGQQDGDQAAGNQNQQGGNQQGGNQQGGNQQGEGDNPTGGQEDGDPRPMKAMIDTNPALPK
ncbi:hypothetical protein BGX34_007045 [Mortierella sp. NVP85]|nr:hypothetical protein BGX34_007045 [Mortierella sp. NVP85]